jgi:hypothetical protein
MGAVVIDLCHERELRAILARCEQLIDLGDFAHRHDDRALAAHVLEELLALQRECQAIA